MGSERMCLGAGVFRVTGQHRRIRDLMRRGLATVGGNVMTCKRDIREHRCVVGEFVGERGMVFILGHWGHFSVIA